MAKLSLTDATLKKYRYWKEFLHRSKKYQSLCSYVSRKIESRPLPKEILHEWCPLNEQLADQYYNWLGDNVLTESLIYSRSLNLEYMDVLLSVYPLFQDTNDSFSNVKNRLNIFFDTYDPYETITCVKRHIKNQIYRGGIILTTTNDDIPKYAKKPYGEYLNDIIIKNGAFVMLIPPLRPYFTRGNNYFADWDRYLDILDAMRLNNNDRDKAFKHLFSNEYKPKSESSHWDSFRKQLIKSEELIHSAELGFFPRAP